MKTIHYHQQNISPSKIVCIGRNYVDHAKELGNQVPTEPVIFLKPNSAIGDELQSSIGNEIHYEGEISLLAGEQGFVAVAFGLDLTKRDVQQQLKTKGLPWERAKAFDGAAVFSEFVTIDHDDLEHLSLVLRINSEVVQQGGVADMLFKPVDLLATISEFMTLEPGDIVMTGTPAGVGAVIDGDKFEGIIYLHNKPIIRRVWIAR